LTYSKDYAIVKAQDEQSRDSSKDFFRNLPFISSCFSTADKFNRQRAVFL